MKMITRFFSMSMAVLLAVCIGLQIQPAQALESGLPSQLALPVISGNTGVPGATLSYFDGSAQTVIADGAGNYSFSVTSGFAGTVTPTKTGYAVVFTPASIDYSSTPVTSDQTNQNYSPDTSWWTVSGTTGLAGTTLSYNDGSPESVIVDGSGNYSLLVPDNFASTITPSLTGYTFSPATIDYSSAPITANLTGQNYTATAITYTISGTAGVAGATLSYTDGTPKTAQADGSGNYTFTVSYNWGGIVTPSLAGYTFSPANIDYSSTPVLADLTGQDYAATAITYTISGTAGVAGATLSYTDGTPKTAQADGSGNYTFTVSYNWGGIVTPSLAGYTFSPANIDYSSTPVLADLTGQNYTATAITYVISGNAGIAGAVLRYTVGTAKTAIANGSGNYSFVVPYHWSGTVTPVKATATSVYVFAPVSKSYSNVSANYVSQNYTANLRTAIPNPQLPVGTIADITPTYQWLRVATATQYEYQLFKGNLKVYAKTVSVSACTVSTCSATPTTTLGDGVYRWVVRAMVDGAWRSFSTAKTFTMLTISTLQQPSGAIFDATPTYKWTRITAATQYEYQLFTNNTLKYSKTVASTVCAGAVCSHTPVIVLADAAYTWKVRARVGGVWLPFSALKSFTLATIPTPQFPSGVTLDTTPTFQWIRVIGATQYQYQLLLGATPVYTKIVPVTACSPDTTCSNTPVTNLAFGAYSWKVQAMVSGAWRPFSAPKAFLVLPQPVTNGNLESGSAGWAEYSTHGWAIITTSYPGSIVPRSGSHLAWLGGDYNDISYIQQQIYVPSALPYLIYWQWIASGDYCGYDFGGVVVNGAVVESYTLCSSTNTGQWVHHAVNLSAYAGHSITLQIRVETDGSNNSNLLVDDISFQPNAASWSLHAPLNLDPLTLQTKSGILPQGKLPAGLMLQRIFLPSAAPK